MKIKDTKLKDWYLIAILAFLGLFYRICFLGYPSLWIDEAFSVNAAQAILQHGYPLLDSGIVYSRDLLSTYLIAFFMSIFGESHFGARFASVIFGTLMIPLAYYFGRELGNRKVGILAALFVTFSVWEIAWSRQARMYQQLQFFYFLSLILFYKFVNNGKPRYFFLTALFTALAILSHSLGYTLLLVYLIYLAVVNIKSLTNKDFWNLVISGLKQKIRDYYGKNKILFLLGSFLLLSSTVFIIHSAYSSYAEFPDVDTDYLEQYAFYLKNVHFLLYYFAIVGAIISLKNFRIGFLLILGYLVPFFFVTKIVWLLHFRYIYFVLPLLFVLASYSILYLIDFTLHLGKYGKVAAFGIALMLGLAIFTDDFVFIPQKEYNLESGTPQPNFAKAYSYIRSKIKPNDIIISGFPAVDKYYLQKADYWIAFSLTGLKSSNYYLDKSIVSEKYANATILRNASELQAITQNSSGWVILDNLAWRRIDDSFKDYISHNLTFHQDASERKDVWSGIRVYSWGS